jgi:phage terminase large subunit GpA-like protein
MMKQKNNIADLNRTLKRAVCNFKPPERLTVSEWAEKYRRLSPESSAEAGPWRNSRTPYLTEIMNAFTDPKINRLTLVAASQVGKSEIELNIIGYIIDQDPGSILYIQPTIDDAKKFSRLRIAPMIRDSKPLRKKVADVRTRDSGNTILQKTFPGGMLTITGSNSASALSSTPARYVIGDERDRWAVSAGTEGDPWGLAEARQTTFYNAKAVEVSTPTIKGSSNIEKGFLEGTQERWCHQCPHCGEYYNIIFHNIRFDDEVKAVKRKKHHIVSNVRWCCPGCGCVSTESQMKKQPAKWIAENPEALEKGHRSFWLNAFSSPWVSWLKIITKHQDALGDEERLKVVFNTLRGELWEEHGDLEDEDTFMARREEYDAELPDGTLCLTCGVDTQDNRLEYEVVGHGHYGETWGIKKGIINGRPDTPEPWKRLDDLLDHTFYYKNGMGLKLSLTCMDEGGHFTEEVYTECKARMHKRIFPIKGYSGPDIPYTGPPTKVKIVINGKVVGRTWHYKIGVDAGKSKIMSALKMQEPGPKYCHFPKGEERGYDITYFTGLLSERLAPVKTDKGIKWQWKVIPGHERNEPLDCRNYAMAAFRILDPDLFAIERRLKEGEPKKKQKIKKTSKRKESQEEW